MPEPSFSASKARQRLASVLQKSGDVVSIADVSEALSLTRADAAKLLARWNAQGWVRRLRSGFYAPVPITSSGQEQVLEDPWVVVPELFGPACIGGWSAAEHWDLTEQLFRSICVLTTRPVRRKEVIIQGLPFTLKHIRESALFGTRNVWRGNTRVPVTTPSKTIVDMLDDPVIGGGIRHVADCLRSYLANSAWSSDELISNAKQLGSGAIFKRLGYLAEMEGNDGLADAARKHLTAGNAKLDPSIACPKLVKRWRLWIPQSWPREAAA